MEKRNKGKCYCCGKEISRTGIIRHLDGCEKRYEIKSSNKECDIYTLLIKDEYQKEYWLVVEVSENTKLSEIDQFLRDIWLECCGHMSEFEICGIRYWSTPDPEFGYPSMNISIKEATLFSPKFKYTYDFGSSTDLIIEIKRIERGFPSNEKVRLLARNDAPEYICDICHRRKATNFIVEGEDGPTFFCDKCCDKIEEGDIDIYLDLDCALPVCNSPRMGVCGYLGSDKYPD